MHSKHMGVNPKIGGAPSKWMVKIMEHPIKHGMIWGAHPYFGNTHIFGGLEHVFPASNSNMVVILGINMLKFQEAYIPIKVVLMRPIVRVVPLPSNRHHQDYCILFLIGNPYKPSCATVTGRGDNPAYCTKNLPC